MKQKQMNRINKHMIKPEVIKRRLAKQCQINSNQVKLILTIKYTM